MPPLLLLAIPVLCTLLGGAVAIRLHRHLPLLIAVGAGLLLGAAFLDVLPEAMTLGLNSGLTAADVLGLTLVSFLLSVVIENTLDRLGTAPTDASTTQSIARRIAGWLLIFHSFRDGVAIGAAYAASHTAGYAVAAGIAAHDLGDGMNTVLLFGRGGQSKRTNYVYLLLDALAPLLGGLLTIWWIITPRCAVLLLTLAAGFFLQMAAGDFLPEIRRPRGQSPYLMPALLLGAGLIYAAHLLLRHAT